MSVPAVVAVREPAVAPTTRSGGSDGFADVLAGVSGDASRPSGRAGSADRPGQDRPAQDAAAQDRPVRERPDRDAERVSDRPSGERTKDADAPAASDQAVEPGAEPQPTGEPVVPAGLVGELPAGPSADPAPALELVDDQAAAGAPPVVTVPAAAEAGPAAPATAAVAALADAVVPVGPADDDPAPSPQTAAVAAPAGAPAAAAPVRPDGTAVPAEVTTPAAPAASADRPAPTTSTSTPATPAAPPAVAPPVEAPAAAVQAPVVAPTAPPAATAAVAAAPPPAPPTPAPLVDQLGGHLRALAGARAGTHVLSIALDPQNLGQVRIVAHISADQVRIDLAGVNDAARAALRGTLDELRRDLQSAGLAAELGLADDDRSERRDSAAGQRSGAGAAQAAEETDPTSADPASGDPVLSGHALDLVV